MPERILVWGAGGHGHVVRDVLLAVGAEVVGFVDAVGDGGQSATRDGGSLPIVAEADIQIGVSLPLGATALAPGIGSNVARLGWIERVPGHRWVAAVHPSATIGAGVLLGPGTIVMAQVAINAGARIGRGVIVNTAAVIEHDCEIGDGVHVSPGAVLCGGAKVERLAWVGAGATVVQSLRIGAEAVVGAGSTVLAEVEPGTIVAGSPAMPIVRSRNRR